KGAVKEVLDDPIADTKKVDTLVLCTGKFYYEMTEKAQEMGVENMAFIRIEQLYPLPESQLKAIFDKYTNVKHYVWAQEEPSNMGAWQYMAMNLRSVHLEGIMRKSSAATAEGSKDLHVKRLKTLFDELFKYAKVKEKAK